jgi:prophage regulatory protein
MTMSSEPFHLLRCKEVVQRTGLSRTTIWRLVKDGAFPAPLVIGRQRVAWREDELRTWLEAAPRRGRSDVAA